MRTPFSMSVFHCLHDMVRESLVIRLEGGIVRSTAAGTLSLAIRYLESELAPAMTTFTERGTLPASMLGGNLQIVSEFLALRCVATQIKQLGSMTFNEAAQLAVARRAKFWKELGRCGPTWNKQDAGYELLARLPLVRVPLESFGTAGGREQSLLVPIVPGVSDAAKWDDRIESRDQIDKKATQLEKQAKEEVEKANKHKSDLVDQVQRRVQQETATGSASSTCNPIPADRLTKYSDTSPAAAA